MALATYTKKHIKINVFACGRGDKQLVTSKFKQNNVKLVLCFTPILNSTLQGKIMDFK